MSKALPFSTADEVPVRALYLGERLDLRTFEAASKLALLPLTIAAGSRGVAVLFRYGVVVLFNVTPIEEASLRKGLDALLVQKFEQPEIEEAELRCDADHDERGHDGVITVRDYDPGRLQTIADVLAKSVVLEHYEVAITDVFDAIEPLAEDLTTSGSSRRSSRELLRHIGGTLLIQAKTVWRVEVTDKPESLWERPDLELFYSRLIDEYELEERHVALERKLQLISRTAGTALELLHNKRSLRVEWYIVILIVIEIVITLYELMFLHR
ncbi:RMD1 family protein [Haliangium sp.]|uniref:RMD1 family protein n=1 Tax=Haliangium sp. TaxID=2663208 RepID=UPI003D0D17CA